MRPDTRSTAPTTAGQGASNAEVLQPRLAAKAPTLGIHLRRAFTSVRCVFKTTYYDSKFQEPQMIEDDYYRLRGQPRGY